MKYKFLSGGQTGVDRGVLDACLELDFPCGGWCPEGRLAEDGPLDEKYPLTVLPGAGYPERTRENVLDSDGTLIICQGDLSGGTKKSKTLARGRGKPYFIFDTDDLDLETAVELAADWIREEELRRINFSGPRESGWPDAYQTSFEFAKRLIKVLRRAR